MNLRERVRKALPEGAFLRRDRGEALYVTDAPRHGWAGEIAGFRVVTTGGIARVYPKAELFSDCDFAPDDFAREMIRFKDVPAEDVGVSLFSEGVKLLEAPDAAGYAAYDRSLRQAAAVALRAGGGGGLYACSLILAEIGRRLHG